MRRGRARPRTTNTTVTIPVSSLSVGAQSANAFTGWTSPATSVSTNSFGGGAANTKYLNTTPSTSFVAKTTGISRDQEITGFAFNGAFYLRLTETGKAWVFQVNVQGSSSYSVSLKSSLTEGTGAGGVGPGGTSLSNYSLSVALPPITSVPGWNKDSNAGKQWTFGVEGFDIYLKYDGVEFWRAKTFGHLEPGRMALGCHPSDPGFRDISATHKTNVSLYSDTYSKLFDLRDLGMKTLSGTGSISAGSTTFTLSGSNPGFAIGDRIVVATGGEAGGGVPGERGVGGQWPSLLYANAAARDSDTTQAVNRVCAVLDTGQTRQWNGSAWVAFYGNYARYHGLMLPKALSATITNVSGLTLTLDTAATASSTGATIYFDNASISDATIMASNALASQQNCKLYAAAGNWVFANRRLSFGQVDGIQILGAGKTSSVFFSPTGTSEVGLLVSQSSNPVVRDLGLRGNTRADKGYFFQYDAVDNIFGSTTLLKANSCLAPLFENIRCINHSNAATEISFCTNGVQRFIDVVHETGQMQYFQWAVNISDSVNCTSEDIYYDASYLIAGLESFRSSGSILRRITGRNALMSSNSNTGATFTDVNMVYETGSGNASFNVGQAAGSMSPSPFSPLVDLNSNIDNQSGSGSAGGILLENCDFTVQGRLFTGYGFNLINMSGTVDNVTIRGKYPTKPVTAPSGKITIPTLGADQAYGVRSDTTNKTITIDGVRFTGTYTLTPILVATSATTVIRNSVLDNLSAPGVTQTNNITNAAYDALP